MGMSINNFGMSITAESVLLLQKVFAYYRKCSLTTESVLLLQMSINNFGINNANENR